MNARQLVTKSCRVLWALLDTLVVAVCIISLYTCFGYKQDALMAVTCSLSIIGLIVWVINATYSWKKVIS